MAPPPSRNFSPAGPPFKISPYICVSTYVINITLMDFYDRTGKMALGSRLRRLSEQMTEQAAAIYDLYQVDLHPKWFPVFYSLSPTEEKSITDIAREIGHTHPSVSQIV